MASTFLPVMLASWCWVGSNMSIQNCVT